MNAEQVKARVIETVTGQVVPRIQAETGGGTEDLYAERRASINRMAQAADDAGLYDKVILPDGYAHPAPEASPVNEALDAFRLGFPNVFVYRTYKLLEARVAELEAKP